MIRKIMLILMVLALGLCFIYAVIVSLRTYNPITRFQLEHLAKRDLTSKAQVWEIPIAEVAVTGYEEHQLTPVERADGLQANITISLEFAYKCPGQTDWSNGWITYGFANMNRQWDLHILANSWPHQECPCCPGPGPSPNVF